MAYPNTALAAWQLAVIAVVAMAGLVVWLGAVYLAAREPRPDHAAGQSAGAIGPGAAGTTPAVPRAPEPARHSETRKAA